VGADSQPGRPTRQLTLFDSVCIIVGIIIGAGIYRTTPDIASLVPSTAALVAVWLLGGLLSLLGGLCYAELATTYPHAGGDYVFLDPGLRPPHGLPLRLVGALDRAARLHRHDGLHLRSVRLRTPAGVSQHSRADEMLLAAPP